MKQTVVLNRAGGKAKETSKGDVTVRPKEVKLDEPVVEKKNRRFEVVEING